MQNTKQDAEARAQQDAERAKTCHGLLGQLTGSGGLAPSA